MKTPYSYVTLRYVHDVVTGEFANVGVVVHASPNKTLRVLQARFIDSTERLEAFFGKIDRQHLLAMLNHLTSCLERHSEGLTAYPVDILPLVRQILPLDDSSLQWSEPGGGMTRRLGERSSKSFR